MWCCMLLTRWRPIYSWLIRFWCDTFRSCARVFACVCVCTFMCVCVHSCVCTCSVNVIMLLARDLFACCPFVRGSFVRDVMMLLARDSLACCSCVRDSFVSGLSDMALWTWLCCKFVTRWYVVHLFVNCLCDAFMYGSMSVMVLLVRDSFVCDAFHVWLCERNDVAGSWIVGVSSIYSWLDCVGCLACVALYVG